MGKGRVRAFVSKGGRVDVRLHSVWAAKTTASIQTNNFFAEC